MTRDEKREEKIAACVVTPANYGFNVLSPSGKTYQIERDRGKLYCSCPARRALCVHLAAVERFTKGDKG
jgi:hypothetical protein